MHESQITTTRPYGDGERLTTVQRTIVCRPADWPTVRKGIKNHERWATTRLGELLLAVEPPRVVEDTAIDAARADWTPADWRFFRKLARREGWTWRGERT